MLRVLTLSTLFPNAARPAFGIFVALQTQALAAQAGVAVEVVSPRGLPLWPLSLHARYTGMAGLPQEDSWNGLKVHRPRFTVWPGIAKANAARALAKSVLPLLRTLPVDVIDAEFFWPDGVAAMHLAAALGVPFTIKARGSDIAYWGRQPAVARQMLEAAGRAGALLAVSESMKREMIALGMPGDKIRIHHTGVDLTRFVPVDRPAAKAQLGIEGPLVVCAGALIPLKGQRLAIEAMRELTGATLLLVGDGPERGRLETLVRELGLEGRVRLLGNRPHDELPGLLGAADVMVLPSEREGLANVWVEALACGTPVAITDVGGAREVVDRPQAGRIVAREAGAIAAAVRDILADPPAPAAVRASAERFSWEKNGRALFEILREVSAQRH
jgi:teichuronic acid biosynthesis glycosyltransferase TuaC